MYCSCATKIAFNGNKVEFCAALRGLRHFPVIYVTKVGYNRLIIGVRSWGKVWRTEFASNPAAYRVIEDEWTTKSFQVALIGVHLPQSQYSLNKAAEYVRVIIPMASNDIKMPKKPLSLDIWVYMPP